MDSGQGIDKARRSARSAIRFKNESFCFFFQKEALCLWLLPLRLLA
jgi:hypothetical protein